MHRSLILMVMSGVDDGTTMELYADADGQVDGEQWRLSIGRRDTNDICLRNDTFVSRQHAYIYRQDDQWWLEDMNSTNGTFIEDYQDIFSDQRVQEIIPIDLGQLFRVGRTWLRIQAEE